MPKSKITKPIPPRPEDYSGMPEFWQAEKQCELDKIEWAASLQNKNGERMVSASTLRRKQETTTLYLTQEGDLYRDPKTKYLYPMMEEKERQKLLRYLIDSSNITSKFISTRTMGFDLEKDTQNIRTEIGKINHNAKYNLKLRDKLIDSKQGSGYRLNPKFKILLK